MPENYKYIHSTGVIVPDTSAIREEVEAEFREAFGPDIVLTPESPAGVLVTVETEARDNVVRNNAELANQINPGYAGGVFLDAIAALTALKREQAVPSIVRAQLTGVPGSILPAGIRAATAAGDVFYSKSSLVLDAQGKGELQMYSEKTGPVPAPAGTLTAIKKSELGWETISNAEPAVPGREKESDAVFRKLREDTLYLQGVALPGAICSGVRSVRGVRSMQFRENCTHEEKEIDGVLMPPHCVYAVVDGGSDEEVAQMLFRKKSLGCNWKGKIEKRVQCPESGQWYTVRFDRPEIVQIRAKVTLRVLGSVSVDSGSVARQAIADYADDKLEGLRGFLVGSAVSPFDMSAAISQAQPAIFVVKLEVGALDIPVDQLKAETMHLKLWQKAAITQGSIEVVGG